MYQKFLVFFLAFAMFNVSANSQMVSPSSGEILLKLKKLNKLGNVLYVAAHPDDENTRMITYFANEECLRTAYLSLTRGDGGQNLIGPEKAEKMGLIRTQELLEARKKDGGIQFFTRANDFGYSKHPDETLEIWGKQEVLSDVVWVIRKFKPDVIITRFSPNSAGMTHGHHTSSAMLAKEAFLLAGDKNAFPEQLEYVDVWQAKRIYWNTSWWFYGSKDFDKSGLLSLDIGTYNSLLGKSYGEIAGASRSMHKSQGFGASESKGSIEEYLDQLDGPSELSNILNGVDTDWSRVAAEKSVGENIDLAIKEFNPQQPALIIPHLLKAKMAIQKINDPYWMDIKSKEIDDLILDCLGLTLEGIVSDYIYAAGDSLTFILESICRAESNVVIDAIALKNNGFEKSNMAIKMPLNTLNSSEFTFEIPKNTALSNPYWLIDDHRNGMYTVNNQTLIGMPESPGDLTLDVVLKLDDFKIHKSIPFSYRWVDRVRGELYRDVIIAPPLTSNFLESNLIFNKGDQKTVKVSIQAHTDVNNASVRFEAPAGWELSPSKIELNLKKQEVQIVELKISSTKNAKDGMIKAISNYEGKDYNLSLEEIRYDHIKHINYFSKARLAVVNVDLKIKGNLVGYIKGAGDDVPEALMQMGYRVEYLDEASIIQSNLDKYDAIVLGVRAYNTQEWLYNIHDKLMNYVENGGNIIAQYNTNRGLNFDKMGPFKLELGRGRVTVEEAEMVIKMPDHKLLNEPNKIISDDFKNWVQERGLYFASSWDQKYEAPFESNDPGEEPSQGMLITAKYGQGYYTYVGISFFRQLPAGVPGAYRLFANIISQNQD